MAGLLLAGCGSGESGSASVARGLAEAPASVESRAAPPEATPGAARQANASPSPSTCTSAITWSEALNHVGEQATVRGPVKGANYASKTKGKPTFLDIGRAYPDPARFTVLIWGDDRAAFAVAPEKAYTGKTICVTGLITSYKGGAEIEVSSPAAITLE